MGETGEARGREIASRGDRERGRGGCARCKFVEGESRVDNFGGGVGRGEELG